jgi:hypothetical protein
MKKIILNVPIEQAEAAAKVAQTFNSWYNTSGWDKRKIKFDKYYEVHETKTGTIVVNAKQ